MPVRIPAVDLHGHQEATKLPKLDAHLRSLVPTIRQDSAVHCQGVVAVDRLADTLLVPAKRLELDSTGPGEAQEPVLVPHDRELLVCRGWVCVVPDEGQHRFPPLLLPLGPELRQDRCGVNPIAVVEVVVVVVAVSKVVAYVPQRRARRRLRRVVGAVRSAAVPTVVVSASTGDQASPGAIVNEGRAAALCQPRLAGRLQVVQHPLHEILVGLPHLRGNGHKPRHACSELATEVCVADSELHVLRELELAVRLLTVEL
mmetsp:Transcript_59270/g.141254  ORF Transcript_59270/g.141254 Transcript_59270/m.141254 type:complete len:258 (-) Transcript_59270:499-1272(-)